jgi:hypothetical protein
MRWPVLFIILILSVGCIRNVDKNSFILHLNEDEFESVTRLCQELGEIGHIREHLLMMQLLADEFLALVDDYANDHVNRLSEIGQKVNAHSAAIRRLISDEYLVEQFSYSVEWKVESKDFKKFLGRYLPKGFELIHIEKVDASYAGVSSPELLDDLGVSFGRRWIQAEYKAIGSALEICQLQTTRMLVIRADYRHLAHTNSRFFNLVHRRSP